MAAKVAPVHNGPNTSELAELQHALNTAHFELNYEKSSRIVEGVTKDEEIRKLKLKIAVMEDEVEELNEQLAKEEERADLLMQDLGEANSRGDDFEGDVQILMNEIRVKERELETAKAEVAALGDLSADTAKVIKEKLAIARELANLKPEIEHLRSQAATHENLLSEKLSLQRELVTLQVELDNSKRAAQKATSRAGKPGEKSEEYEAQIEELKSKLEDAMQIAKDHESEIDSLKRKVVAEKKNGERAAKDKMGQKSDDDEIAELNAQLETLKKELATEKKNALQIAKDKPKTGKEDGKISELKSQLDSLKKDFATEKKERQRLEKALEKEKNGWEAQRAALEDKLASFRAKLRSTKEKLKENEAELECAQKAAANATHVAEGKAKKTTAGVKRMASLDPDAAIGTPGDHAPAKRGRKGTSNVGDKSTFSITPFLNRTMSVAPDSPGSESGSGGKKRKAPADEEEEPEEAQAAADESTPSAVAKKARTSKKDVAKKPNALAPASSAKQNSKPSSKRNVLSIPTLEKVAEESEIESAKKAQPTKDAVSENDSSKDPSTANEPEYKEITKTTTISTNMVPKLKPSNAKQPRKSLLSFATFTTEPEPEKKKKKSRKLNSSSLGKSLLGASVLGAEGKTLFDEDDDADKPAAKPIPGRGLGAFAKRSLLGKGRLGKAPLVVADDGFAFSPLKRDRKAAAMAQSMLGN